MRSLFWLVAAGALAGCKEPLSIAVDRPDYSPVMSYAPGLGMAPAPRPREGVRFHWHASCGRFLRWQAPSYKVEELGADVRGDGEKVYWTYDPAAPGRPRPDVLIELTAEDASGTEQARAGLRLRWDGDAVAVVR